MILFPQRSHAMDGRLADAAVHGARAHLHGALALGAVESLEPPDFGKLEKVQELLQNPSSMLAAWTHYIAFDLFVGRWIWETSLEEGRPARLSLLLTWWAGPLGLTLFLARRRFG